MSNATRVKMAKAAGNADHGQQPGGAVMNDTMNNQTAVQATGQDTSAWREGQALGARFEVRRPFSSHSRSGSRFATFELWDGQHGLRAYAWASECRGFFIPRQCDRIYAAGRLRRRNGRWELVCTELRVEDAAVRIRWARDRMRELVRALSPTVLGEFVRRVFNDPRIGPAFVIAPASLNHHHAYSGGLLVHSAECAAALYRWTDGEVLQGLATTAAMLHDIGKVRTLAGNLTRTALGRDVRHEDLTLEVLAPHLAWLDGVWADGANTLRHLLTAEPRRDAASPSFAALTLLRAADRISATDASTFASQCVRTLPTTAVAKVTEAD